MSRRRSLWLGFLAALLPLAILVGLHFRWLSDLERTSAIAARATLRNYVEAVAHKVEAVYVKNAERALNVPASRLEKACLADVANFFRWRRVEGAKRLFLVSYLGPHPGTVYFFDPEERAMAVAEPSAEAEAIYRAIGGWRARLADLLLEEPGFQVDERDPDNRVVFNPIVDADSRLLAIAGMVLDRAYLEREVLPQVISGSLPELPAGDLRFAVRDGAGRPVAVEACGLPPLPAGESEVEASLRFVFTDWRIGLGGSGSSVEQWARANFVLDLSLSLALTAVLLGGVLLALRTASREMKLSEMKNDFVSNVSHELRTPVSSIRVFGELLRLGKVDDAAKAREFGEYIENESRRLSQLINNILDFSKIESGRKLYRFEPARLDEVLAAALEVFELRLRHSGLELELERPAVPLAAVEVDAPALTQAVCNLLDNAVKYSGDGERVVLRLAQRGGEAVIEVEDEGIGISKDEQEKIFERFHRVGTGAVHDVKGSGLGLSIVQHVVEAHGGRVTVRSEPGRGSTFAIRLPLAATAKHREPRSIDVAAAQPEPGAG